MRRKEYGYIALLLAAVALAMVSTPRDPEAEWRPGYGAGDARPYGSRMLFETLPALFDTVRTVPLSPYEWLGDSAYRETSYLFVTESFMPDPAEAGALLDYVRAGNNLFVAAAAIAGPLAETLDVRIRTGFDASDPLAIDTLRVNLSHPALRRAGGYFYDIGASHAYIAFDEDAAGIEVLGAGFPEGDPNFVRIRWGEGDVYLHALPKMFANYTMLVDDTYAYTYGALSYLPASFPVFWDEYYKPFKRVARTPLRFVLAEPALRSALFIALAGLVLFVVFQGKRRQRPIPVIEPPRNMTAEFVETVGRLYLSRGDHRNLALKLIEQWKHYARSRLFLDPADLAAVGAGRVAARSGVDERQVCELLTLLEETERRESVDEGRLRRLARALDAFYAASMR